MKKDLMLIVVVVSVMFLALFGCAKKGESVKVNGALSSFNVQFLFEVDGVRIYRFNDQGQYYYFSSTKGLLSGQENVLEAK